MKLSDVEIRNFRNISHGGPISVKNFSAIIGRNNEGKSAILSAIVIAATAIKHPSRAGRYSVMLKNKRVGRYYRPRWIPGRNDQVEFDHMTDVPVGLNFVDSTMRDCPAVSLSFSIEPAEAREIKKLLSLKSLRARKRITVSVYFLPDGPSYLITLEDTLSIIDSDLAKNCLDLLGSFFDIQYIPSVRTVESGSAVVKDVVVRELESLTQDSEYREIVESLKNKEKEVLSRVSERIKDAASRFISNVDGVKIEIQDRFYQELTRRDIEILVNDGSETPLSQKGDGVQSLFSIAVMRQFLSSGLKAKNQIIAIEEPETHLHPGAVRELRAALDEISVSNQTIFTTHHPLLVNREVISQNIIVRERAVLNAVKIDEIRSLLGISIGDNLISSEVLLIVEGDSDKEIFENVIGSGSVAIRNFLASGVLSIDVLGGASKLTERLRARIDELSKFHVFLDDDAEARQAFDHAKSRGLIDASKVNFSRVPGKQEAEIEDLVREDIIDLVFEEFCGAKFSDFKQDRNKKWSKRAAAFLAFLGKRNGPNEISYLKNAVSQKFIGVGIDAVHESRRQIFRSVLSSVERICAR